MIYQQNFRGGSSPNNPFGSLLGLLLTVGVLVLLFFAASVFVKLLYFVAPLLLIATLLINYKVVADYALDVVGTFKTDLLWGVLKVAFAVIGYPFIIGWLFAKALFYRKINNLKKNYDQQMNTQMNTQQNAQLAEYEELSSEIIRPPKPDAEPTPFIELPKPKEKPKDNLRDDFDQLFK